MHKKVQSEIVRELHGAIILLDLDNSKEINDSLAHTFGDLVLKEISNRLFKLVGHKVFVSRFDGELATQPIYVTINDRYYLKFCNNVPCVTNYN